MTCSSPTTGSEMGRYNSNLCQYRNFKILKVQELRMFKIEIKFTTSCIIQDFNQKYLIVCIKTKILKFKKRNN